MAKQIHICQSIEGALKNWDVETFEQVARDSKCTIPELRAHLQSEISKGHKVLPISGACEGFSYLTGCPGHETSPTQEGS